MPFAVVVALLASPSTAVAKKSGAADKIVMLPIEGEAVPSLSDELIKASKQLSKTVEPSSLGMEDLQLAVGCGTLSVKCLQKIGETLKASMLLIVRQRRHGNDAEVSLRLVTVTTGADRKKVTVTLSLDPIARRPRLRAAVAKLFGMQFKPPPGAKPTGRLELRASVRDVEVEIDGQSRGTLPLDIERFPVGKHTLVAKREGFRDWSGSVDVRAGKTATLHIQMETDPNASPRRGFWRSIRAPTWIVAGAGLAAFGVGAAFGAHMIAQQNEFNDNPGATLADLKAMQDLKDTGDRDALVANVMWAVGGAALVAAAIMAYIDYRRAPAEEQLQQTEPAMGPKASVRVGPGSVRLDVRF